MLFVLYVEGDWLNWLLMVRKLDIEIFWVEDNMGLLNMMNILFFDWFRRLL